MGGVEECTCLFPGRQVKYFSREETVIDGKRHNIEVQKFQRYRDEIRDHIWLLPIKRTSWINQEFRKQTFYLDVSQRFNNYLKFKKYIEVLPSYRFSLPGKEIRTVHGVAIVPFDCNLKTSGYHCVLGIALDRRDDVLYSLLRPTKELLSSQLDLSIKCYYLSPSAFNLKDEILLWNLLIQRGAIMSSNLLLKLLNDGIYSRINQESLNMNLP
jgi:hypothetical protein